MRFFVKSSGARLRRAEFLNARFSWGRSSPLFLQESFLAPANEKLFEQNVNKYSALLQILRNRSIIKTTISEYFFMEEDKNGTEHHAESGSDQSDL